MNFISTSLTGKPYYYMKIRLPTKIDYVYVGYIYLIILELLYLFSQTETF